MKMEAAMKGPNKREFEYEVGVVFFFFGVVLLNVTLLLFFFFLNRGMMGSNYHLGRSVI